MTDTVPVSLKGYQVTGAQLGQWWQTPTDDEETPELRWPLSVQVYDRMRRQDAQVMSVLRAVTLPIRRTTWRIDPANASDAVTEFVADNLGLPVVGRPIKVLDRTADRFSWGEHLRHALLMLPNGHSFFEQNYRIENGEARLHKLLWLPPRTLDRIDVGPDGGLVGLHQYDMKPKTLIEVARLVAYTNDREGGNWLGSSLLRPAYKFWLLKDRALRTQAQSIDRNGMGLPVYTASPQPDSVIGEERTRRQQAEIAAGSALAQAYRGGDNAGAAIPNGAKIELVAVSGTLPDAEPVIRYYDEQIARAVLAHFLNLGTQTGSWALGSTFADFFTLSLQTVANDIADVTNQHVVEDLVDHNFGPSEPAPRVTFDEIGSRHAATAEAIKALVSCGAITLDDALDQHLRTTYGLPAADPTTRREAPKPQPFNDPKEAE